MRDSNSRSGRTASSTRSRLIGALASSTEAFSRHLHRGLARLPRRASRVTIVLSSAAIVAVMVGSVVLGPLGNEVLAQDGYGKRAQDGNPFADLFRSVEREVEAPTVVARAPDRPVRHGRIDVAWSAPPHRSRPMAHRRRSHDTAVAQASTGNDAGAVNPVVSTGSLAGGQTGMCVRLCDGYYFPLGAMSSQADAGNQESLCAGLCPGAPTRLFSTFGTGTEIDGARAVSTGQRYDELPVAFAHTREVGPTCACHPAGASMAGAVSPLRDFTLRQGDSVMTPVGWRVFHGADHWPYRKTDFAGLRQSPDVSKKLRPVLAGLEDAALGRRAPAAAGRPLLVTRRPRLADATEVLAPAVHTR